MSGGGGDNDDDDGTENQTTFPLGDMKEERDHAQIPGAD